MGWLDDDDVNEQAKQRADRERRSHDDARMRDELYRRTRDPQAARDAADKKKKEDQDRQNLDERRQDLFRKAQREWRAYEDELRRRNK
jgi:hypothetical protein